MLAGATLLAACDMHVPPVPGTPRPAPTPAPEPVSERSLALKAYYGRVQNSLLTQGLLRTDGGGPDTPFDARILARNFMRIALYEEYTETGGRFIERQNASRLHRWDQPVTLSVRYGDSVPTAQRAKDNSQIARYTKRLSRTTGLPISQVESGGNFKVLILNEDERRALAPALQQIAPGIGAVAVRTLIDMPRETYCLAIASDPDEDGTYAQALVVIRSEHPDLLRTSCIHEELAQALGLSNDSPHARPSIFNDDEEFGLLTTHDELLLKMLYDPRLRPGMTEAEARPIVNMIAAELMGVTS